MTYGQLTDKIFADMDRTIKMIDAHTEHHYRVVYYQLRDGGMSSRRALAKIRKECNVYREKAWARHFKKCKHINKIRREMLFA